MLREYLGVFCLVYLDNILVYTKRLLDNYKKHIIKILEKLAECKLILKPVKCKFYK